MESHKIIGRDNGRTPIQWDDSPNAGFTSGNPWIKVNPNYHDINIASQEEDPNSELNYLRKMIRLRKQNDVLVYGDYQLLLPEHTDIYTYTRTLANDKMLVILSFSKDESKIKLTETELIEEELINNYDTVTIEDNVISLLPYQAVIFKLEI